MPTGGEGARPPLGADGFKKLAEKHAAMNQQIRAQAAAAKGEITAENIVGKLGRTSRWDNTEKAEVSEAVDGAIKRGDIEVGPGKFEGVHFASRLEEEGHESSPNPDSLGSLRETVQRPGTAGATGVDGKYIVLDDEGVGEIGADSVEKVRYPEWTAIQSVHGAMTHELGHVYAIQAANNEAPTMLGGTTRQALESHGLDPESVIELTGSPYAGYSPHEAFAELYAKQYAGGGLDQSALADFKRTVSDLRAHGAAGGSGGSGGGSGGEEYGGDELDLILPSSAQWAKILKQSAANVKAGRFLNKPSEFI